MNSKPEINFPTHKKPPKQERSSENRNPRSRRRWTISSLRIPHFSLFSRYSPQSWCLHTFSDITGSGSFLGFRRYNLIFLISESSLVLGTQCSKAMIHSISTLETQKEESLITRVSGNTSSPPLGSSNTIPRLLESLFGDVFFGVLIAFSKIRSSIALWLLPFLISPATLLALERANNDLLMFFLVCCNG